MEEWDFDWRKERDGICVLRCYGTSASVRIPSKIRGIPVTGLSDYAFSPEKKGEPDRSGGLPCICGPRLSELSLPVTVRRIGRYAFYNCRNLERLFLHSSLASIGSGAFTGCDSLSVLAMRQEEGDSCLREILQDLKHTVQVDCFSGSDGGSASPLSDLSEEGEDLPRGGLPEEREDLPRGGLPGEEWEFEEDWDRSAQIGYRLVFPEFFEEAVENTPARITVTQTHGMGIQYRNAFRDTRVAFREYDKLFETAKYNVDADSLARIAEARLQYPHELGERARGEYREWLLAHLKEAAGYFLDAGCKKELRWMAESLVETRGQAQLLVQEANERADAEALSVLMDVTHKRFPTERRRFAL